MEELLTTVELTGVLKTTKQTVSNWVKSGMPYVTKNPYRYKLSEVIEWINKRG